MQRRAATDVYFALINNNVIDIEKFSNGTFNVSFWYNNSAKSNKNSNKFFGGHVVIAGVNITSNYKISNNLEFSIEG